MIKDENGKELVRKSQACPECGERLVSQLHLAEDKASMDCASCGCVYVSPGIWTYPAQK